jgi:hypothetical protein
MVTVFVVEVEGVMGVANGFESASSMCNAPGGCTNSFYTPFYTDGKK